MDTSVWDEDEAGHSIGLAAAEIYPPKGRCTPEFRAVPLLPFGKSGSVISSVSALAAVSTAAIRLNLSVVVNVPAAQATSPIRLARSVYAAKGAIRLSVFTVAAIADALLVEYGVANAAGASNFWNKGQKEKNGQCCYFADFRHSTS